jgi:hypothetical protein
VSGVPLVARDPGLDCAETFDPAFGNVASLANDLLLVRVATFPSARHVTVAYDEFAAALERYAGAPDPAPADLDLVTAGFIQWNSSTYDLAPTWVGLWMETRDLFGAAPEDDTPGWADAIRDRFGLYHLGRGRKIVLFRYRVSDLPRWKSAGGPRLIAVPSVLDSAFFAAFCPAPRAEHAGRVVNLHALGDAPNREFVHAYRGRDVQALFRVGVISSAPKDLGEARQVHLDRVRAVALRPDYGMGTDP